MWEGVGSSFSVGTGRSCGTWRGSRAGGRGARGGEGGGVSRSGPAFSPPRGGGGGGAGRPRGCWQQRRRQPAPPPGLGSPGRAGARPASRGAAARGPGKVSSPSAEMPGSDTALTVDRTYSDPGRHHRFKSRVRGAGRGVALGAPGRGARTTSPRAFRRLAPAVPSQRPRGWAPSLWRGWEGRRGSPARGSETPGPSPGRGQLRARPAALGPRAPGSPRRPELRRPLRQGAPAALCRTPGDPATRGTVSAGGGFPPLPEPRCSRPVSWPSRFRARRWRLEREGCALPGGGEAADPLPGSPRPLLPALPQRKVSLRAASSEFLGVRSRRPLHCLQCNLLLLISAVGENSFSESAAETSPSLSREEGLSLSAGPSGQRKPPRRGCLCSPGV